MNNYIKFDTRFFDDFIEKFEELGSEKPLKEAVGKGLVSAKEEINENIVKALAKPNLPAKGKYSYGWAKKGINKSKKVSWSGSVGTLKVGFDGKTQNIEPVKAQVLIYGKPSQKPVKGLKDAIFGDKNMRLVELHCVKAVQETLNKYFAEE